jgi:hypothetical protein
MRQNLPLADTLKAKGGVFPTPETYLLLGETALPLARIEIQVTMILLHSGCPPHPEWSTFLFSVMGTERRMQLQDAIHIVFTCHILGTSHFSSRSWMMTYNGSALASALIYPTPESIFLLFVTRANIGETEAV